MSENKDIDQLLNDFDQFLEIDDKEISQDLSKNLEKISNQHTKDRLREKTGHALLMTAAILMGIMSLLNNDNSWATKINSSMLCLIMGASFIINQKAKKEIKSQNFALNLTEFKSQRRNIALTSLKQMKAMRLLFYLAAIIAGFVYCFDYNEDPSMLKLIVYVISFSFGGGLMYWSMEGGIKYYADLAKSQE